MYVDIMYHNKKKQAQINATLSTHVPISTSISIKTPVGTKFDKKFNPVNVAKISFILKLE
jgi:hypothetical protein